jgi:hypothetical protein
MRDPEVRTALLGALDARHSRDPDTVIYEELALRSGATRIDIAVVNSTLHGYEIKTDNDTLDRLCRQAALFSSALDRVTLVVARRHACEALRLIPHWWGVHLVSMDSQGAVQFSQARKPRSNPSLDILEVARLLWRDEALQLLEDLGAAEGVRSKTRAAIFAKLSEVADLDRVRACVRYHLANRTGWRSDARRRLCDG